MYVYLRSEPQLWTVGFYDPNGKWIPESDHGTSHEAAERVHWLNGNQLIQQQCGTQKSPAYSLDL